MANLWTIVGTSTGIILQSKMWIKGRMCAVIQVWNAVRHIVYICKQTANSRTCLIKNLKMAVRETTQV